MAKILKSKFFTLIACICLFTAFASVTAFATDIAEPTPTPSPTPKPKTEISVGSEYKKVYDGKEVGKSDILSILSSKSGNGVTYFTYKWYDSDGDKMDKNPSDAGRYKLEITVSDKDPVYTGRTTVNYIIEQRPLEWNTENLTLSKPYDGTATAPVVKGEILVNGIISGDDIYLSFDNMTAADFPSAEVQRTKLPVTITGAKLAGDDAENYILPKLSPEVEASIVKAYVTEVSFPDNPNRYRTVVEEKVVVADALAESDLGTAEAIKAALREKAGAEFADKEDVDFVFYTAVLQVFENGEWVDVTAENNPADGTSVILPYPADTKDSSHDFVVYHMKSQGDDAGLIEVWAHTEKVEGLEITLSQGDPVIVVYTPASFIGQNLVPIICGVAVAAVAAFVFFKLLRKDREETKEEAAESEE